MFKEICQFIEDKTSFVKGTTLQVGHYTQDAPERCILVGEPAGGEPNFYNQDMANLNIQVISRGKTYFDARDDAWEVHRALTNYGGQPSSGWNLPRIDGSGEDYLAMAIDPIQTPTYIGQDENKRFMFSVNYIFRMEEASCGP
jgi:hypothetical protein